MVVSVVRHDCGACLCICIVPPVGAVAIGTTDRAGQVPVNWLDRMWWPMDSPLMCQGIGGRITGQRIMRATACYPGDVCDALVPETLTCLQSVDDNRVGDGGCPMDIYPVEYNGGP